MGSKLYLNDVRVILCAKKIFIHLFKKYQIHDHNVIVNNLNRILCKLLDLLIIITIFFSFYLLNLKEYLIILKLIIFIF